MLEIGQSSNIRYATQFQNTIDTCPDVQKWEKTFPNYIIGLGPSMGVDTTMFVEIITQFHTFNLY